MAASLGERSVEGAKSVCVIIFGPLFSIMFALLVATRIWCIVLCRYSNIFFQMEKSCVQPREERLRQVSACLEGLDEVVVDQLREQAILKQTAVEVFNHVYFACNF